MSESNNKLTPAQFDDGIDLRKLIQVLWAGKWLIGGITAAAATIAVIAALMLPNIYRAEALLAPNEGNGADGFSALGSQYSNLVSLAGIDIGRGIADQTTLGLEILKSRKFITEFVERHDILVPLLASEGWDSTTGELRVDSKVFDVESRKWVRNALPGRSATPSQQEAYEAFRELLSVEQDSKTGFVSVAMEHYSPGHAKQWVDWLIEDLNSSMMHQDVADAEQAIEFLNEQIHSTSLADLQSVFFSLIEEQMKTVMLAKASQEYVLRTIDPAVIPEEKAKPRRSLMVVLAAFLGGLFGTFIQLVRACRSTVS